VIHTQATASSDKKAVVFRNQAAEVARFIASGGLDKIMAVDSLADAAVGIGIDPDTATAAISEAIRSAEAELADKSESMKPIGGSANCTDAELPAGYLFRARGLCWRDAADPDKPELWLAGPFRVLAETRDVEGNSWGVLLYWKDHDGREHRLALPRSSLAGDGADARRALLDGGLPVAPGRAARDRLTAFLTIVRSPCRMTATLRIGWHGTSFVLPDRCVGAVNGEEAFLQSLGTADHAFRQKNTLEQWQHDVARLAIGNSRLALAIAAAFASALVGPCESESGGLHFRGASSIGKSTALAVAGSVWGGAAYVCSWRATANGLEAVALRHCDALLCLDELAQITAREAAEVAYMLANGSGKSRSARDGTARRVARWRLLFLSSGEIGLADKVAEDGRGKRIAAGQQVRIVDIPADPGAGFGLFEELHGFPNAEALATHLRGATQSAFGSAAGPFLKHVTADLDRVRSSVRQRIAAFVAQHVAPEADGQVHRVAQRFALIAAAGELAVEADVLPWRSGEASTACSRVYQDWLDARGDIGPAEISHGLLQVRSFLLAHGMSRFLAAWDEGVDLRLAPRDMAGFRKREIEGWDYYVTPSAWKEEICRGFDSRALADHLIKRGWLLPPSGVRHRAKAVSVPGQNKLRLYHVPACFLAADD
jgi:putative DNA primase/helicase